MTIGFLFGDEILCIVHRKKNTNKLQQVYSTPHGSALRRQSTSDANNFAGLSWIVFQCSTKLFICWKPMEILRMRLFG